MTGMFCYMFYFCNEQDDETFTLQSLSTLLPFYYLFTCKRHHRDFLKIMGRKKASPFPFFYCLRRETDRQMDRKGKRKYTLSILGFHVSGHDGNHQVL